MHWGLNCFGPPPAPAVLHFLIFAFAMPAIPLWFPHPNFLMPWRFPFPFFFYPVPRRLSFLLYSVLLSALLCDVLSSRASFQFIFPKILWRPFRRLCSSSPRPDGSVIQWHLIPWWRLSLPARSHFSDVAVVYLLPLLYFLMLHSDWLAYSPWEPGNVLTIPHM